jgi:dTDP-4-dehydrorhamnose 3,5-epimerase
LEIIQHRLEGVVEIIPQVFHDERGYFFESYHEEKLRGTGIPNIFIQDNQSFSVKGVLRGLHFQLPPYAQGKLVRVMKGKVLDIAVDIRPNSPTFGEVLTCILDDQKHNSIYIPPGFAHGFSVLEDSIFVYKCTAPYHKPSERGILWCDEALGIDWQLVDPIVSEKDKVLPPLATMLDELKQYYP